MKRNGLRGVAMMLGCGLGAWSVAEPARGQTPPGTAATLGPPTSVNVPLDPFSAATTTTVIPTPFVPTAAELIEAEQAAQTAAASSTLPRTPADLPTAPAVIGAGDLVPLVIPKPADPGEQVGSATPPARQTTKAKKIVVSHRPAEPMTPLAPAESVREIVAPSASAAASPLVPSPPVRSPNVEVRREFEPMRKTPATEASRPTNFSFPQPVIPLESRKSRWLSPRYDGRR